MSGTGSVYSSTDQINLLKNIFTPQFQVGQGGYFHPTVHTYLPGDVEIGDPTTNYNLFLNGNALATDLKIAAWSGYPAISTLSMGANNITNVGKLTMSGGNYIDSVVGSFQRLSNVKQLNGFDICLGSALTIGTDKVFLASGAGINNTGLTNQVCIGYSAGYGNRAADLVAIGQNAGNSLSSGSNSICIGSNAGQDASNFRGIQLGDYAGYQHIGRYPVMIGAEAGSKNNGNHSTGIGYQALMSNTGDRNIGIGMNAATNNSGWYVVAAGYQAGLSNKGSSVVALGYNSGYQNAGTNCVFLGSNSTSVINTSCTTDNTFYVYSTTQNTPFLQGDMSANVLGIGTTPRAGFALTVQGSVQNRLNVSTATGTLNLTSANAATRFFVSNTVTLSFATGFASGTHWIVTNTSTAAVVANLCGGTVQNSFSSVTLPATISGVGRGVTFAYAGTVSNFYSF
jgi:hypothetical protein